MRRQKNESFTRKIVWRTQKVLSRKTNMMQIMEEVFIAPICQVDCKEINNCWITFQFSIHKYCLLQPRGWLAPSGQLDSCSGSRTGRVSCSLSISVPSHRSGSDIATIINVVQEEYCWPNLPSHSGSENHKDTEHTGSRHSSCHLRKHLEEKYFIKIIY